MSLPTNFFIGRGGGSGPLWDWPVNTEYEFTSLNASGESGPTPAVINAAYSSANFYGSGYFGAATDSGGSGLAGIQRLVIPEDGTYKFSLAGARGGSNSYGGGGGGTEVVTTGPLTQGTAVLIVVGQQGGSVSGMPCGGGGGSFAYIHPDGSDFDDYDIFDIIAAAGGGSGAQGGQDYGINSYGMNAVTSQQGGHADTSAGQSAAVSNFTKPARGHAGIAQYEPSNGRNYQSSGGAGFLTRATMPDNDFLNVALTTTGEATSGVNAYYPINNSNGVFGDTSVTSVTAGSDCNEGGSAHPGNSGRSGQYGSRFFSRSGGNFYAPNQPWMGGYKNPGNSGGDGGFGGGSGGADNCGGSGAGGGFSGGMGAGCYGVAGGGGSYGRDSSDHANFAGWTRNSVTAPSSRGNQVTGAGNYSYGNNGLVRIMRTA